MIPPDDTSDPEKTHKTGGRVWESSEDEEEKSLKPSGTLLACVGGAMMVLFLFNFLPNKLPLPIAALSWFVLLLMPVSLIVYRVQLQSKQRLRNEQARLKIKPGNPFVLYLRPFMTATRLKVHNNTSNNAERYFYGPKWDLEFAISVIVEPFLLVAVGEQKRSFGAAKILDAGEEWFDLVRDLTQRADLIFIVPLDRPATLQEMRLLMSDPALAIKTVIIMPPRGFFRLFSFIERSWNSSKKKLARDGIDIPEYDWKGAILLPQENGKFDRIPVKHFDPGYMKLVVSGVQKNQIMGNVTSSSEFAQILDLEIPKLRAAQTAKQFIYALVIATVIRTVAFEHFNIPSGSMIPTLIVGDYLFVSKYSYGYSRHSMPFSPDLFPGRIFGSLPERGDVAVFKLPRDNSTDYIKRIIGLPGDRVQMRAGVLHLNGQPVRRELIGPYTVEGDGPRMVVRQFRELLPQQRRVEPRAHHILEMSDDQPYDNTTEFVVPADHVFALGNNRDNSLDSRAQDSVGFIPVENLVGRAEFIFFSVDGSASWWEIWAWPWAIRWSRLFSAVR